VLAASTVKGPSGVRRCAAAERWLPALTQVVARLLSDPRYAAAVGQSPWDCLLDTGLTTELVRRIGRIIPAQWVAMAREHEVWVDSMNFASASAPSPKDWNLQLVLSDGTAMAEGPKRRIGLGHRTVPFSETIRRAERVSRAIGVTRLSQTTGVDRIGIPVWSAICPSTESISVYNGKGVTDAQARAGALMEAVERYCAEQRPADCRVATVSEISRVGLFLHPCEARLALPETFDPNQAIEWTQAWDLMGCQDVWVPAVLAMVPYRPLPGALALPSSSNGLASGNTIEEAICHGLAELIERDADTLTAVRSYLHPIARAIARTLCGQRVRRRLRSRLPEHLDLSSLPSTDRKMVERFNVADVDLCVLDVTSDLGIPCFRGMAVDGHLAGRVPFICDGAGAHPTPEIALHRAITEAAQSRVTVIQGAREDIPEVAGGAGFRALWPFAERGTRRWTRAAGRRTASVCDDIRVMLAALGRAGIRRCLVKDRTLPQIGIPVAKVIVPELEDWSTLATHGRAMGLGRRGLDAAAIGFGGMAIREDQ